MPVHNALPFLDEAVESILRQTFSQFDFIILDDASTDGSTERLREWAAKDGRIRLIEAKRKLGPVASSQRVADEAVASVVARMDADDISDPDRLRQQVEVLREHQEVGLVASLSDVIDSKGRKIRGPDIWRLVRKSANVPFAHSAIMYRNDLFRRAGGYRQESHLWEDQDLVMRMARLGGIMVIPHSLLQVRQSAKSTRSLADLEQQEKALNSMYRRLSRTKGRIELDGKVHPSIFLALGSVELWAGGRPRLFRRLLERGRLSVDRGSLAALGWTAWASLSPSTLRAALRALAGIRNAIARRGVDTSRPVAWSPAISPKR